MKSQAKRMDTRKNNWRSKKNGTPSGAAICAGQSTLARILSCRMLNSFEVLIALVCCLVVIMLALVTEPTAHASNPSSGSLTLT